MRRRDFIKSALGSALLWKHPSLFARQAASAAPPPDRNIKRVLVMFKCHFDAGFIDTQTKVVHPLLRRVFPASHRPGPSTSPIE
jgi:hypothetical protein